MPILLKNLTLTQKGIEINLSKNTVLVKKNSIRVLTWI